MLDGKYGILLNSPMGPINGNITLITNGNNVQGILDIMGMNSNLNGFKISNDKCKFTGNFNTPLGNINYDAVCTVNGNSLQIDANTKYGNLKIEGKRK